MMAQLMRRSCRSGIGRCRMAGRDRGTLVADLGGPTMFARVGVLRAMNRRHVREFNPRWAGAS
jgi:hypothetical protein